eukprot:TRINITY_DN653_c0_g1_i1.p1 TRINITY_DN653_c0_g1~~TRINITY_DN653_c0_g1_i1.p1  ORF type:complete len:166 (+),score=37.26 TRINITY_DN653_c0_g1_i1:47-499(+)
MATLACSVVSIAFLTLMALVVADEVSVGRSATEKARLFEDSFMIGDADRDGELSEDEAVAFVMSEHPDYAVDEDFAKDVRLDLQEFDHDNSGTLSKGEFIELMHSQDAEMDGHHRGEAYDEGEEHDQDVQEYADEQKVMESVDYNSLDTQ